MTTFLTKKEHIFIDNYSMSEKLCKIIIEKFEMDIENNNNLSNNEDNETQEKIIDKTYEKIYLFIINELNKNIVKYVNFFNIDKIYNITPFRIQNVQRCKTARFKSSMERYR